MKWIRRIGVTGSTGDNYTVAISDTGAWGCSCPRWRFSRKDESGSRPDCKHIEGVRRTMIKREVDAHLMKQAPRFDKPRAPVAPRNRFAGLELDAPAVAAMLDVGARFRYLDLDMTVIQ